jgi:hypothetical protein
MKTQNLICTLFIILLLSSGVGAQNFNMGVMGGLNLASISTDMQDTKPKTLTAFNIGTVVNWKLGESLVLCFEPMYLQKGANFDIVSTEDEDFDLFGDIEAKFDYAYLELPVLFKYMLGSGKIKPYLMAGPSIALLTKAEMVLKMMDIASFSVNIKEQSESFDFGVGLGAGVNIPIGKNSFFVEGRYALGLVDVFKGTGPVENEDELELEDADVKHTGIQIMAGITIPLGE